VNDTFEYDPLFPCGIVDPHQPTFVEGRTFVRNAGTLDVVIASHQVLVYANETEAAAVMAAAESLGTNCPNDEIEADDGTVYTGVFQSCDVFESCEGDLAANTVDFLAGDQYVLQLAFLAAQNSDQEIIDQIYSMRIGRSIVMIEYIVPSQPTEAQFTEASNMALTAWGRVNDYPR